MAANQNQLQNIKKSKIMNILKEINSLETIPVGDYVGYYWGSASTNPQPWNGFTQPELGENEFIQEAMLWDESKKLSIMIQHTHRHIVTAYDLSECTKDIERNTSAYMAHRIPDHKKLKFYRHWEEEEDPLCDNLPVLKMKAQVFCGFHSEKKDLTTEKI